MKKNENVRISHRGFWGQCRCGWSGYIRHIKANAERDYKEHRIVAHREEDRENEHKGD